MLSTRHTRRGVDAVPVVFAVLPGGAREPRRLVIPVDAVKAKRSPRLQRVVNIERDPRCVLLVDHYEDDWTRLWWVRVHGRARWWEWSEDAGRAGLAAAARATLADRYPQYRPSGSVVGGLVMEVTEIQGWRGGPS